MADKLLYRQIHPEFVVDEKATLQVFKPTKNPDVSVYDGSMIDARSTWEHYIRMNGRDKSDGVMVVTNKECESQDLTITSDHQPSFKEYMLIGFDGISNGAIKEAVRPLTADANKRG